MDQRLRATLTALAVLSGIFGVIVMLNSMHDERLGSATIALAIAFAGCMIGRCLLELAPRS